MAGCQKANKAHLVLVAHVLQWNRFIFNDLLYRQWTVLCILELAAQSTAALVWATVWVVLDWFRSYLSGRTFRVVISDSSAYTVYDTIESLTLCAPSRKDQIWGSVIHSVHNGPIGRSGEAWCVFARIRWWHANVSTLSPHPHVRLLTAAAALLELCISDIGHWMSVNRLKLNMD